MLTKESPYCECEEPMESLGGLRCYNCHKRILSEIELQLTQELEKCRQERDQFKSENEILAAQNEYLANPANWDAAKAREIYHKTREENQRLKRRIKILRETLNDIEQGIVENANDTVWLTNFETVCDRIQNILSEDYEAEKQK